jgi:uncharacterized protein YodC (DUF2158 family)
VADTQFKIGDTVRLKSGGPLMTIEKITPQRSIDGHPFEPSVNCIWFEGPKKATGNFHPNTLVADDGGVSI